ncbi:D-amino-acid oxidase [Trichinella pseudospiralis]
MYSGALQSSCQRSEWFDHEWAGQLIFQFRRILFQHVCYSVVKRSICWPIRLVSVSSWLRRAKLCAFSRVPSRFPCFPSL